MIAIEQIKAARGLLEWTQDDLAHYAKISRPTLTKIECRQGRPHTATLLKIQTCLEKAGVEFMPGGVRLVQEMLKVKLFDGDSAVVRMLQDVYRTHEHEGGIVRFYGLSEHRFADALGQEKAERMIKHNAKLGIDERLLVLEGDMYFIQPKSCYRWLTKEQFVQVPYYVYGNKLAMVIWEPVIKIVVIENAQIAASYRQHFDYFWERAALPP